MQSWSLRSAERQDTDPTMLRRFVEASRRAEIIALVNAAGSDDELGEVVTAELCEAFEAEVAFMVARPGGGATADRRLHGALQAAGREAPARPALHGRSRSRSSPWPSATRS